MEFSYLVWTNMFVALENTMRIDPLGGGGLDMDKEGVNGYWEAIKKHPSQFDITDSIFPLGRYWLELVICCPHWRGTWSLQFTTVLPSPLYYFTPFSLCTFASILTSFTWLPQAFEFGAPSLYTLGVPYFCQAAFPIDLIQHAWVIN